MAGFQSLPIRDLVALVVIATRTLAEAGSLANPKAVVEQAFGVADEFMQQSEGHWATSAREEHRAKKKKRQTNN